MSLRKGKTEGHSSCLFRRLSLKEKTRSILCLWRLRFEGQSFVEGFHQTISHFTKAPASGLVFSVEDQGTIAENRGRKLSQWLA